MPSKHRYQPITPRVPTELKDRAQRAVSEMGLDLSALVTTFLRWYVGDLDELPERPVSRSSGKGQAVVLIECKLCRAELQKHPSYAKRTSNPIASYLHPLGDFPRAYGTNADNGHDIRNDNCGSYGVNTAAKLAEHHLPWGWIDEQTGVRLCCNENQGPHYSCARERFHEGEHKDASGHAWSQRNHFLLTRVELGGSVTHLDLYDSQANARTAAWYDLGTVDTLEWVPREGSFHYYGRLPSRLAYVITYIDVSSVRQGLESATVVCAGIPTAQS